MGAAPLILIAEHDTSCRNLITRLLRRIGLETVEATTGPETLEAVARLQPSLVVLDVGLPEVSGYEVCRKLRASAADTFSRLAAVGARLSTRARPLSSRYSSGPGTRPHSSTARWLQKVITPFLSTA